MINQNKLLFGASNIALEANHLDLVCKMLKKI